MSKVVTMIQPRWERKNFTSPCSLIPCVAAEDEASAFLVTQSAFFLAWPQVFPWIFGQTNMNSFYLFVS